MGRNMRATLVAVLLSFGTAAAAFSGNAPTPVSPGGSAESPDISTPCPTFSWGAVEGAKAYELAVFEQAGEYLAYAENLELSGNAVLTKIIPAPALSWTPGAGHCLSPDNSYTWYIRSVDTDGKGIWSQGQAFDVASRFSGEQFDAAVASAVERYISEKKARGLSISSGAKGGPAPMWEAVPPALQKQNSPSGDYSTAGNISPAFIPLDGYEGEGSVYGNYNNTGDFGYVGGLRASVYGKHSAATVGDGVRGFGAGTYANGVTGETTGTEASGVAGKATGVTGQGIYGYASSSGDYLNHGGFFRANGKKGIGVYGEGSATGLVDPNGLAYLATNHTKNYGGYFLAHGSAGRAVYGKVDSIDAYYSMTVGCSPSWLDCIPVAGMFEATGPYSIGVIAKGTNIDFYAGGAGTNFAPFTGSHEVRFADGMTPIVTPGKLVSTVGQAAERLTEDGEVSLSSTLPTVRVSDSPNDPAVFGALVRETQSPGGNWYAAAPGERFGIVNALGEGRLWVSDANGPITAGDLITTSILPGYGQKQDDDVLHSYTAAKATETVDWDNVTDTVEHNGRTYKVYLVAVVYTSG